MTFTGGTKFHEIPVSSVTPIARDMRGTNVIGPGGEWFLGFKLQDGSSAVGDQQISISVNCYVESVDREIVSAPVRIVGGIGGGFKQAAVTGDGQLRVAVEEFRTWDPTYFSFLNDTYGADIAQNVTFGGTAVNVHDGGDNAGWTWSDSGPGSWDATSTDQAADGAASINFTAVNNGGEGLATAGAPIVHGSYTAITGAIYITGWSVGGAGSTKDIRIQLRLAGVDIGG